MRGGAIDYYSNNVQVAPDGALARSVSKAMFRSFKSTNYRTAGMSWQMLSRKQPRTARRLLNWPWKSKQTAKKKKSRKWSQPSQKSLLSGCDKYGLKTGFVDKLCLVLQIPGIQRHTDFQELWISFSTLVSNKLGGPVCYLQCQLTSCSIKGFRQSYLLWPCSLLILGSSVIPIPFGWWENLDQFDRGRPGRSHWNRSETYDACRCSCNSYLMVHTTWNDIMKLFWNRKDIVHETK